MVSPLYIEEYTVNKGHDQISESKQWKDMTSNYSMLKNY